MHTVILYYNPACGTSRNTLALIRNAGIEPEIIEYLHTPPDQATLCRLLQDSGLSARAALRTNAPAYTEQGLDNPDLSEAEIIAHMLHTPILINRPFVVTAIGTALCRPSEKVLGILPAPQQGAFYKEDGEQVTNEYGQHITNTQAT